MEKAVPFLLKHCPQNRSDLSPGKGQLCVVFVLKLNHDAVDRGEIIYVLAGLHHHRVRLSGKCFGKALRDTGVALPGAKPTGNDFLVPQLKQSTVPGQNVLQIAAGAVQIGREVFGNGTVPGILIERRFKLRLIFGAENGIELCRVL